MRRELSEDFALPGGGRAAAAVPDRFPNAPARQRFTGLRFRLRGGVPRSIAGRVMAGVFTLGMLLAFAAALWEAATLLLHDPHLLIPSSAAVRIEGNHHLSRAQLLSVFGEDVERNILTVPLDARRTELEGLPWVQHATVMRLLPNGIRVVIAERTPVAFARQGRSIGLVDAHGVLLDMASQTGKADEHYSFPVITGLAAADPLSVRAARMQLFARFTRELDGDGVARNKVSDTLSEVDLSNPEDVKALLPSAADGRSFVLVHFGEDDFLNRYKKFEANLPGWKAQYPRLASVDMRYERQVVLEMQPGRSVPASGEIVPKKASASAGKKGLGKGSAAAKGKAHPMAGGGR